MPIPMLTLGLMEGALAFAAIALIVIGLCTEEAPMHRVLGPLAVGVLGVAAIIAIVSEPTSPTYVAPSGAELLGIAFAAFLGFLAPLGVMRYAWVHRFVDTPLPHAVEPKPIRHLELVPHAPEAAPHVEHRPAA